MSAPPPLHPVTPNRAVPPLVAAIDIGSSATRCGVFDAYARPVEGRWACLAHSFTKGPDGTSQIDPEQVVQEVTRVIATALEGMAAGTIQAVGMCTFASSLICVNDRGDAISPCYTYADGRSAAWANAAEDIAAHHQRTGTRPHASYWPSKLLWLREQEPALIARTARFLSIGQYVQARLGLQPAASLAELAWAGMLDRQAMELDTWALEACGVGEDQFAPLSEPGTGAGCHQGLRDAMWFSAIPDGYASNLGVGADDPSVAALSAATTGAIRVVLPSSTPFVPPGLWGYTVAPEASLVGGALNDVGRLLWWLDTNMAPVTKPVLHERLIAAPRTGTPLVLPFLTGERATGWTQGARAVFAEVSVSAGVLDLWRGACEGIAVTYARVFHQLLDAAPDIERVVACGGAAKHYPGLIEIVAQALGVPVELAGEEEDTLRGTAIHALRELGGHRRPAAEAERHTVLPDPDQRPYCRELQERFEVLYSGTLGG